MARNGSGAGRRIGRLRVQHLAAIVVLALALSGIAAGCSSGGGGGLSSACQKAQQQFHDWQNATSERSNSARDAANHWIDVYNRGTHNQISPQEIQAGIAEYNADVQKAQAASNKVAQESAKFQKALSGCNQSSEPKACQEAFAQYLAAVGHEQRETEAVNAVFQAIDQQVQALQARNIPAMNAATGAYNAAFDALGAATREHNDTVLPAVKAAEDRCSKA